MIYVIHLYFKWFYRYRWYEFVDDICLFMLVDDLPSKLWQTGKPRTSKANSRSMSKYIQHRCSMFIHVPLQTLKRPLGQQFFIVPRCFSKSRSAERDHPAIWAERPKVATAKSGQMWASRWPSGTSGAVGRTSTTDLNKWSQCDLWTVMFALALNPYDYYNHMHIFSIFGHSHEDVSLLFWALVISQDNSIVSVPTSWPTVLRYGALSCRKLGQAWELWKMGI